ncbi:ABC-F family ATP-binding cassette domain-containing protein [Agilicoccus flavus]|uniref:ABC-F family ATP-binding cassette domain-containing protein n=1 Tax=Agilicoccus flavus TaxID=2775968 RepID=UPI001CF6E8FB|nr:ATP-binding cassette domain-containing protein [Agilicoccus flavus]
MPAHSPTRTYAHPSAHLRCDGISFSYGAHRVLTDVSLTAPAGTRTGLIGENGSGKSTLLRIAAGELTPDAGTVTAAMPGGSRPRIGLLHQETPFDAAATVARVLDEAVAHVRQAVLDVETAAHAMTHACDDEEASEAYARALERAEDLDAWNLESRVHQMLTGLGLGDLTPARRIDELSGGQASRLALAALLLSGPDILLLDEPTNHLDDAATAHLRDILMGWSGPVLIVSHDRAFLDDAVTQLVDLDPSPLPDQVATPLVADGEGTGIGATRFTGTYSDYLTHRRRARQRWQRQYDDEQVELARLSTAVEDSQTVGHADWQPRTEVRMAQKYYADRNAKVVSRRVKDARTRLAELQERQLRQPPAPLSFHLPDASSLHGVAPAGHVGPALVAEDVGVTGRLSPTSFTLQHGEAMLLTGANGAGKSTLLHVLAGEADPTEGQLHRAPGVRIGLLTQENHIADPHGRGPSRTARQAYADLVGVDRAGEVPLDTFGLLQARDEDRPVEALSVGQQRRLSLAVLLADPPDLLLLDEPTNHLSLLLVTELEAAIAEYPGTVLIASHDRWLRSRWPGHHLHLEGLSR